MRRIFVRVVRGELDAHEGSRQVRQIYFDESALMSELKFLAENLNASREEIKAEAGKWLKQYPSRS